MKVIQFREEAKLCLFTDDIVLCIENPKGQDLLELISKIFVGYKINAQKAILFLYTSNKLSENEMNKTTSFIINSFKKNEILKNKLNKRCS